jgi:hydrogenase expression/formation protein HypE
MTQRLIEKTFYPPLENPILLRGDDGAVVEPPENGRLAVSTDAHIVSPLFFPGGDIGRLAVSGTVNDLAMMGAQPLWLTASFILEEGLPVYLLEQVLLSMQASAEEAGIKIIAEVGGARAEVGDAVLLSGTLGDHGIAVLAARGELAFETKLESDVASLNSMVEAMFSAHPNIHVLRDPTRGGLATSLNEIARQSGVGILLDEVQLPVMPEVMGACEMLGFDPIYVANEGKLIAIVPAEGAEDVLKAMQAHPLGAGAVRIGEVQESPKERVLMRTAIGATRVVDVLAGEMLPRIC